ncbi:MAG TPA: urea amidolyase associated protein UAAP1 [Kineosporiaceae bacterium]|nr:urea amidolyase associated protein UAAP1 [Kineosporiaceae bacterium]
MSDNANTATTLGARAHARAQGGGRAEAMPILPAAAWAAEGDLPAGVEAADLIWAETVAGGGYTSKLIARGSTVRLTDLAGDACAHLLLFNADQTWERLNVADTVKVLWQAYLGPGHLLLSDQGRVLASIVTDTSGHHDALCGTSSELRNLERYGDGSAQGPSPAGRELQLLAVAKHGMSARDIGPGLSFFKGVRAAADGALTWTGSRPVQAPESVAPVVEFRAEMPLVVVIANVPHPLDPRPSYQCSTLEVLAWSGPPTSASDPIRTASPEAERAFLNTDDYLAARGIR